jgi:archaellum component FlaC
MNGDQVTIIFGILITVIGALLARSINHIDTTIKNLVTKVENMSTAVNSGEQLRKFQNQRIRTLERNSVTLTDAFHEVDVLLEKAVNKRVKLRRPADDVPDDDDEHTEE